MSYEIIWQPHGVVKRFFGHVTERDMVQSVIDTESDARFDSLRFVINDFRGVTGCSAGQSEVEEIVIIDKGASLTNPDIRIAVVASLPEIVALATQYAESPMNAYSTRIFASMEEAGAWLGLPSKT